MKYLKNINKEIGDNYFILKFGFLLFQQEACFIAGFASSMATLPISILHLYKNGTSGTKYNCI